MPYDEDMEQDTDFYEMDDFVAEDSDYRMVEHLGKLVCKFEAFRIGDRVRITRRETVYGKEGGKLIAVEYDPHNKEGSLFYEYDEEKANERLRSGIFTRYLIQVDGEVPDFFKDNRLAFFKHDNPIKM